MYKYKTIKRLCYQGAKQVSKVIIEIDSTLDLELKNLHEHLGEEPIQHLIDAYTHFLRTPICPTCGHDLNDDCLSDTPEAHFYS